MSASQSLLRLQSFTNDVKRVAVDAISSTDYKIGRRPIHAVPSGDHLSSWFEHIVDGALALDEVDTEDRSTTARSGYAELLLQPHLLTYSHRRRCWKNHPEDQRRLRTFLDTCPRQ